MSIFDDPKLQRLEDPEMIARERKKLGLRQRDLADKSGLKLSYIANIEAKRRKPSKDALIRIWDVLAGVDDERRKSPRLVVSPGFYDGGVVALVPENEAYKLVNLAEASQLTPSIYVNPAQLFEENKRLKEEATQLREIVRLQKQMLENHQRTERINEQIIAEYRKWVDSQKGETADKDAKIAEAKRTIALLSDLCNVQTREALAHSQAEELKEKIEAIPEEEQKR